MQDYHTPSQDVADPQQRLMSVVYTKQLTSVERDLMPQFMHKEVISNSSLTLPVACFMTALNMLSQKTFELHSVVIVLL